MKNLENAKTLQIERETNFKQHQGLKFVKSKIDIKKSVKQERKEAELCYFSASFRFIDEILGEDCGK